MRATKPGFVRAVFGLLTVAIISLSAHPQAFGGDEAVTGRATPTATPTPSESILWNFGNGTDGQYPAAGLIMDASGNLYGTTSQGGPYAGPYGTGSGTVFMLTPPSTSGGSWAESILWDFDNGADGETPSSGLVMDANGNFYGTTSLGGSYIGSNGLGLGTMFKLTPPSVSGGNWDESILWNFGEGTDGQDPAGGLIMDTSGNFYGTTVAGGTYGGSGTSGRGFGTLFELTSVGNESILWNFGKGADGRHPDANLIMDQSGNVYGTTNKGGAYGGERCSS